MKPGYLTTEFYLTAAATLISLLGASGVIGDADLPAMSENIKNIVLGIVALASVGRYVIERSKLKKGGGE